MPRDCISEIDSGGYGAALAVRKELRAELGRERKSTSFAGSQMATNARVDCAFSVIVVTLSSRRSSSNVVSASVT